MTDPSSPTTEPEHPPPTPQQTSANQESIPRHSTLKKKASIRRTISTKSKANTTNSSPESAVSHDEPKNDPTRSALYCPVPINSDPTGLLASRFQGISFQLAKD